MMSLPHPGNALLTGAIYHIFADARSLALLGRFLPAVRTITAVAEARPHRPRTPAPPGQPVGVARDVEAEPKIAS